MYKRRLAPIVGVLLFAGLDLFPCALVAQIDFDHLWSFDTGG